MQQTPSTFPSKTKQRSPNIQHATCILESMSIEFIPTQIYTCSCFFVPSYMVCISIVYQIIEDSCECMWGTCFHSFEISSLAVFGYSYMAKGGLQFPQWNLVTHKVSIAEKKKTKCIFTVFNWIFVRVQRSTEHQSEMSSEVIYTTLKICSFLLSLLLISLHLLVLLIM